MARPKATDPKEKLNVRLRQSRIKHLKKLARGKTSVTELIENAIDKVYPIGL